MLIGVVGVCVALYTGNQVSKVRNSLNATAADFKQFTEQVSAQQIPQAEQTLRSARADAADARDNSSGPNWWLASKLPVLGDDVSAVQTVASVADTLASRVLPGVLEASTKLSPATLRPLKGRVDLDPIIAVAPAVISANDAMQQQRSRVARIDSTHLLRQLRGPVVHLQDQLNDAAALTDKASRAVQLIPPMLGTDGKRTYLALFQNNAEIRATGGIPGAFTVFTADHGKITMVEQGSAGDMGATKKPVLPLTMDERALFGIKLGTIPQDLNFTPDFPRTAELAQAMWKKSTGTSVDGVFSADPVALSYLLAGTRPVALAGGQPLTPDNAVQLLLNQVYLKQPDPGLQDAFFAGAARAVFDAAFSGRGDPRTLIDAMSRAGGERRLIVWSAHRDEQALIETTSLGGALPSAPSSQPNIGVYFNSSGQDKMSYYLDYRADVRSTSCGKDGQQQLELILKMRSLAPKNVRTFPPSVVGLLGSPGARLGAIRATLLVYAPVKGTIRGATIDGQPGAVEQLAHEGRQVTTQTVDVLPGQQRTLRFIITSAPGQPGDPTLLMTPGARRTGIGTVTASVCS